MVTIVRLDEVSRAAFDVRLAQLGRGRLTRVGNTTYLEIERPIEDAIYHLASAGIRVTACTDVPRPATGLRPALAFDLAPLAESLHAIDVVETLPIPLSVATAALMHRRVPWPAISRMARDQCRRLLHDQDVFVGWRRVVWCPAGSLRAVRAHVRLRPVVFDRGAVEREPTRWTSVHEGAIERWAFN